MLDKKNPNTQKNEDEKSSQEETNQTPNKNNTETFTENELSKLKSSVNKLSNDLQTTVTELKKSIVDIRSAVSEIENPFNLLRTISSEKDLKNISEERLPPGIKSIILEKPQENDAATAESIEETKAETKDPQFTSEPKTQTSLKIRNIEEKVEAQSKPTKASSAYLDWVWDLLESGLKASEIHQLACSCEYMGYLPEQTSEVIYSLAVAAEKLRGKGFTKSHVLLNLYKAATISKVNISQHDVETLIAITENQLKRVKVAKGAE